MNNILKKNITKIFAILNKKEKIKLVYIVLIMVLSSVVELISIGTVVPVLGVISDPGSTSNIYANYGALFNILNISEEKINNFLVISFCVVIAICGAFRVYQIRLITNFSFSIGLNISYTIYEKILLQKYEKHILNNSSDIISSITMKVNAVVRGLIYPILNIISGLILIFAILFAVLSISPLLSGITLFSVSITYFFIYTTFRSTLANYSKVLSEKNTSIVQILRESLTNIRDVIIGSKQKYFLESYYETDKEFRNAQAHSFIIQSTPRFFIETSAIIIIILIASSLPMQASANNSLILMGGIVYGTQRLLPIMQLIYSSISAIKTSHDTVNDTLKFLTDPVENMLEKQQEEIIFNHKLEFKNVSYIYPNTDYTSLKNINLLVSKGSRVGIIGRTGSGKSTFSDILTGLLDPSGGDILIDGMNVKTLNHKKWHTKIGYVPQDINMLDATIAENVAFGVKHESIDFSHVQYAIKSAGADEFISRLENGAHSWAGENGINFSGGQRQRLAIARALYRDFEILVLDEATSALDKFTEKTIQDLIYSADSKKTIFIIAHREELLSKCDVIVEFFDGSIKSVNRNEIKR
jgi:ATP-binding cassette subfamily B protein